MKVHKVKTSTPSLNNPIPKSWMKDDDETQKLTSLLALHTAQTPTHFLELAAMPQKYCDDSMCFDEDGDFLHACDAVLHKSDAITVRVLIPRGTDRSMAVRQLKKLTKMLKRSPELMVIG